MLFMQNCNPVLHKDEWYITFDIKDDEDFDRIKSAIHEEVELIFPEDTGRSRRIRVRRCKKKCTVNFMI